MNKIKNCKRCGECCLNSLCECAKLVFSGTPPCPALVYRDNMAVCLFIETEKDNNLEPILQKALGVGSGCTNENKYC